MSYYFTRLISENYVKGVYVNVGTPPDARPPLAAIFPHGKAMKTREK